MFLAQKNSKMMVYLNIALTHELNKCFETSL